MHVLSRLSHGFHNWFSFAVVAGLLCRGVGGATRHTVVCSFVCVCVCVCVRNAYLSNRLLLSAETCNTGRSR